eukprot:TRINITY_DN114971_c0_g1_i1.p1 TRINITY_DN114971_c0_g1~~TRINITY_DN114971_c0_g1_i1.p1  ORF type:complete len:269 (+),score=-2.52 TRINITY_DN114971_c0_g1_i1:100-906(+)
MSVTFHMSMCESVPTRHVACAHSQGENRQEEFLKIHPNMRIPVLADGSIKLGESLSILRYLCAKHPHSCLSFYGAGDIVQQAKIDELLEQIQNGVLGRLWDMLWTGPYCKESFGLYSRSPKDIDGWRLNVARQALFIQRDLAIINNNYFTDKYILDRISLADFLLYQCVRFWDFICLLGGEDWGVASPFDAHHNIKRWIPLMQERKSSKLLHEKAAAELPQSLREFYDDVPVVYKERFDRFYNALEPHWPWKHSPESKESAQSSDRPQ